MKLLKVKLNKACQLVAITDDKDVILTIGAFKSDDAAETASGVLYTLLCNLGILKKPSDADTPHWTIEELLKTTNTTGKAYVKELEKA